MKILFIRHGQTEINASDGMHTMNDDTPLSEVGLKQAHKLIPVCKENNVQLLFSSNETRARQTAEIIAQGLSIKNNPQTMLHERNWGQWESKLWPEIKAELEKMSIEQRYTFVPPQGESWLQMETRLKACLQNIINEAQKTNAAAVALVTHGGALRSLMPILLNTPKETSLKYDFENASVTIFDYNNGILSEIMINNISHLS